MEILDYLKHLRRRALWLLVIPAVAGLLPMAYLFATSGYEGTATVAAPTVVGGVSTNQYRGADAGKLFVANLGAALKLSSVLREIASDSGKPVAGLRARLSATPVGSSTFVRVHYRSDRRSGAQPVAQAAAQDALRFLFSTQVTVAKARVATAQHTLELVDRDLTAFAQRTGTADPETAYQAASAGLASLQAEIARSTNKSDPTSGQSLRAQLDARQATVLSLAAQTASHQTLLDRRKQAVALLTLAQQAEQEAEVQLGGAGPDAVLPGHTVRTATISGLGKVGGAGAAVGVFVAVALVVGLDVREAARRRPRLVPEPA